MRGSEDLLDLRLGELDAVIVLRRNRVVSGRIVIERLKMNQVGIMVA